MENIHYLSTELPSVQNYPEVSKLWPGIEVLMAYAEESLTALYAYNEKHADKIDVSVADLQKHIKLARRLCVDLSEAPNIYYDLILEVRNIQMVLQSMYHSYLTFGTQYIGTPKFEGDEEA